jgi:hypothetical protein
MRARVEAPTIDRRRRRSKPTNRILAGVRVALAILICLATSVQAPLVPEYGMDPAPIG